MKEYFRLKDEVNIDDFKKINPNLMKIFADVLLFFNRKQIECVVTSMTGSFPGRISRTHETGRAMDISVRGLSDQDVYELVDKINYKHHRIGAISYSTGDSWPIIYHKVPNSEYHIHIQVRPLQRGKHGS